MSEENPEAVFDMSHARESALDREILEDPGPPYLGIDLYPPDFDDPRTPAVEDPPWRELLSDPRIYFVWLKALEGLNFNTSAWAARQFKTIEGLIGARRGKSFLLGLYDVLIFGQDGAMQADRMWACMEACGWREGDMSPTADLETFRPGHPNWGVEASRVVDVASAWCARMRSLCGVEPILYARGIMRDLRITDRMGFTRCSAASYTEHLHFDGYAGVFDLDECVDWQYAGDGVGVNSVTKLPLKIAGHGIDLTVAIEGASTPTLRSTVRRLSGGPLSETIEMEAQ